MGIDKLKTMSKEEQEHILNNLHPLSVQSVTKRFNNVLDRAYEPATLPYGERVLTSEAMQKIHPSIYKNTFNIWLDNNPEVICIEGTYYSTNELTDVLHTYDLLNSDDFQVVN